MRPRLLVLTSTYPRWQSDHEPGFVHELSKRLADNFDVAVLAPHAAGSLLEENMEGVRVYRYRYAPAAWEALVNSGGIVSNLKRHPWKWLLVPGFFLAQMWKTWALVHRLKPDVIHAHWLVPQGLLVTLLALVSSNIPPIVVTSHGADLFTMRTYPFPFLKKLVIRHASGLTVASSAMKNDVLKLATNLDKLRVAPMGVDLSDRFTPDPSVDRTKGEILFVGRLVEKKGLRHLIAVMPEVISRFPEAFLTVVGTGPELTRLRAQTAALHLESKVNFVGAATQKELPAYYRRAALFVAPFILAASGDQEGLGLVTIEAVGCGCPVLAGNVPAVQDVPVCSIDVTDHAALADAIIRVLGDPGEAQRIVSGQRRICESKFDWKAVAENYFRILDSQVAHRLSSSKESELN